MVTKKNYTNYNGLEDELLEWQFENLNTPTFEGHEVFEPVIGRRHILADVGGGTPIKETYAYLSDLEAVCDVVVSTRTAVLALMNSGTLDMCKTYAFPITQASGGGTVYLKPVDVDKLGPSGHWHDPAFSDHQPYVAYYDIVSNELQMLHDPVLNNTVYEEDSIAAFPWDTSTVANNFVQRAVVNYTAGNFTNNNLYSNSTITLTSGNFRRNVVHSSANVTVDGKDFDDNIVHSDATIVASGTGDVENSTFAQGSNFTISNVTNFDNSSIGKDANLTQDGGNVLNSRFEALSNSVISGGVFNENVVGEDANVNILSGSNFENTFGRSTVYNQVGTGWIRYSNIAGTTTWTNGNTNVSNVTSNASTVNTTGSTGTISNSTFSRLYAPNMQDITSLTITDSEITSYSQVSANGALRLYVYRTEMSSGARLLVTADKELDVSFGELSSYGYIQTVNGKLIATYPTVSNYSYIQHNSTGTNNVTRAKITTSSNLRFLDDSTGNRFYYSDVSSNSSAYFNGTTTNTYMYYSSADARSTLYAFNSVDGRMYYNAATANSRVYSYNNSATHYLYQCTANSGSQTFARDNTGSVRMYSVATSAQSIARLQNSAVAGRLYYSSFTAYYYLYITFSTAVTRSALHGYGRRTYTIDGSTIANGTYTQNF